MGDQRDFTGPVTAEQGRQQPASGDRRTLRTVLLVIVAVVLAGWALHATATVAVPLVASILIALAVMPVRDWVRRKVPERFGWLGVVAAMALLLVVIGVFSGALWLAAQQVVGQLPAITGQGVEGMPQGGPASGSGAGAGLLPGVPPGVSEAVTGVEEGGSSASAGSGEVSGGQVPG